LTVSIRQLGHGFAGQVLGVDCRKPLSSGDVAAIHAGMNDCAVLVFRDQKLSDEEQLRFTLHFGKLEETRGGTPGPIHFRTKHEVRKLGRSIKDFSNIDAFGKPLATDSRAYLFKLADQLWHSDSSFNAVPASYSLLSGRSVPSWAATPNLRTCEQRTTRLTSGSSIRSRIWSACIPTCIRAGSLR
jgi:alpha-ketoglutarate-dependent 2,4-dichlorophenoxyacetate dioxygenase